MGLGDPDEVVGRVRAIPGYVSAFKAAYPGEATITLESVTRALATFERTLVTRNSPHDRFVAGETAALAPEARRGMRLFHDVGCGFRADAGRSFGPTATKAFARFPEHPASPSSRAITSPTIKAEPS